MRYKNLRNQYASKQKQSACDVIMDYYEMNDFEFVHGTKEDHNAIRAPVLKEHAAFTWTIKEVYRQVTASNKPPLMILEELKEQFKEYSQFNDIWKSCVECIDCIIDLLV